jgi:SAM-dependent methyltransferase
VSIFPASSSFAHKGDREVDALNFDRIARPYRWLEYLTFGPWLQCCRSCFLADAGQCRSALVLGDGDGRFTARLLAANPEIRVHAVDVSPAMLAALRKSAGSHAHRITTEVADLRHWQPSGSISYDLVVTHFFLDCLTDAEISALARRLAPTLAPDAIWLVSEFASPPTVFGRVIAAPLIALLYRAFHLLTGLRLKRLPDHRTALEISGWLLQSQRSHLHGLLISQLWVNQPRQRTG